MGTSCLFADDERTAEQLVSHVVSRRDMDAFVGVALYPEARHAFEEAGLRCISLDSYAGREEETERGREASRVILELNDMLGLGDVNLNSFRYESFDPLYSYHFVNYYLLASAFLHIACIQKVLREIKPERVYAVDVRRPVEHPVDPRPRSMFIKVLVEVCDNEGITAHLIPCEHFIREDAITGLPVESYRYRNRIAVWNFRRALVDGPHHPRILRKVARYWGSGRKSGGVGRGFGKAILYVGLREYFNRVIARFRGTSVTNICLDYSDSTNGYCFRSGNVVLIDYKYLVDTYAADRDSESLIAAYGAASRTVLNKLVGNDEVRSRFRFKGVCFYDILADYLRIYVDRGFPENLKIYIAIKKFVREVKVRFALAYCGWTLPRSYSIHEGLKSEGVMTAYYSHGLNIVNKEIAESIKGDGTLMPCEILFSPGPEFEKRYVENGFKDDRNNYITGFPFYEKAKRIKGTAMKRVMKRLLGLNPDKRIVLYPLTYGQPLPARPHLVHFSAEYSFVKKTAETFREYEEFQLVIKAKHKTVPDRCYLRLFNDNYPGVVLRHGSLKFYLAIADIVINFASSSGFDALIAGVPVLYFKPYTHSDWFETYASGNNEPNYFLQAKSYEDIPRQCRKVVAGEFPKWYEEKMGEVERTFMPYSGATSAKRIAEIMRRFMKRP